MMKSIGQIQKFLARIRPSDDLNRMAILGYCRTVLGIRVRFKLGEDTNAPSVTLESFKKWLERDLFYKGDAVIHAASGAIGIVSEALCSTLRCGIVLFADGKLARMEEIPVDGCRYASMEEMCALQRKMNEYGILWDRWNGVPVRKDEKPRNNQYVRICVAGHRMGLGIFREIDKEGKLVFYCVKMEDAPVRYSLYEVIGDSRDYQLTVVRTYERNILNEELKKEGVVWNGHLKRLEPANVRASKGGRYYYINECFEVASAQDNYKPRDARRLAAGNYFLMEEHARPLLETIRAFKAKKRKGTR